MVPNKDVASNPRRWRWKSGLTRKDVFRLYHRQHCSRRYLPESGKAVRPIHCHLLSVFPVPDGVLPRLGWRRFQQSWAHSECQRRIHVRRVQSLTPSEVLFASNEMGPGACCLLLERKVFMTMQRKRAFVLSSLLLAGTWSVNHINLSQRV